MVQSSPERGRSKVLSGQYGVVAGERLDIVALRFEELFRQGIFVCDNISGIADQVRTLDIAPLLMGRSHDIAYGDGARGLVHGKTLIVTGAGGSIGREV